MLFDMPSSDLGRAAEIWAFRASPVSLNGAEWAVTGAENIFGKWGVISKGEVQGTQKRPNF